MRVSEAERQFYLGIAGIRTWYAREPLPGAAPSPVFEFPEEVAPPALAEPEARVAPAAAKTSANRKPAPEVAGRAGERIAHLQALMAGENTPANTSAPEATTESGTDDVASRLASADGMDEAPEELMQAPLKGGDLKVTLGLWAVDDVLLLGEVSDDASTRLQDSLAGNILKALGYAEQAKTESLQWPVFANPLVPGNGFADFTRVLKSLAGEREERRIILLGVLPGSLPADRDSWLASTLGQVAVDFPHTLAELAAVPSYKRALWEQLKPLARSRA